MLCAQPGMRVRCVHLHRSAGCVCAGAVVCAIVDRAAFPATTSVMWVRRPLVQPWPTVCACFLRPALYPVGTRGSRWLGEGVSGVVCEARPWVCRAPRL
jgi:hypothetical protein